ncbi:DUF4350 domain-containing protein [Halorubrum halophilum]|uniref:DUF4350 domain-containing protein n=1 Tax=Halorubrum halophilum TaxID=413816 RepID=UPI00186AC2D9|nr:DUF4350 domain-containing protein [Halorubrum halophilum]
MTTTSWRQSIGLPQLVLIALCVVLMIAVLAAGVGTAAPFAVYNNDWTGTTDLRNAALMDNNTSVSIDSPAADQPPPSAATTALVLGIPENTTAVESTAAEVLANGGTVAITDETPATTNTLLETLGATARVERGPIRDPRSYYRQPVLPVVTTTNATGDIAGTEVTLNHAGTLAPGEATVLAATSQFAYIDENQNEQFDAAESLGTRPVMTREPVDNGTIIVISDSSVFINAMYEREGNRALAEWLYTGTDSLLLSGSAVQQLPQFVTLLLWIKSTPISQSILLTIGVGTVLLVTRKRYRTALSSRLQQDPMNDASTVVTDTAQSEATSRSQYESGLMSHLRTEHPEWDRQLRRRLVTAVMTRRGQSDKVSESEEAQNE